MPTAETGSEAMTFDALGFGVAMSPRLHQALLGIIDNGGCAVLDHDLSELRLVGSTGLVALVRAHQRPRAEGGELRLSNASPPATMVLDITSRAHVLLQVSVPQ